MKYYKKLFILVSISLILCFITSLIYVSNIKFYGNILVITENTTTLVAKTPLNNSLNFEVATKDNKKIISYSHKRFYANLKLVSNNKNDILNSKIYTNANLQQIKEDKITNNNNYFEYDIPSIKYSFVNKYVDFFKHQFTRFKTELLLLSLLIVIIIILLKRKIILKYIKPKLKRFQTYTHRPIVRFLISLTIGVIGLGIALCFNKISRSENWIIDNYVYLENVSDQYDYHTIAINYLNGEEFMTNGMIKDELDYRIIKDEQKKYNIENITGIKALNRFPAYPFVVSIIYKLFGYNPIAVKIFQLLILLSICVLLPIFAYKLWELKGFYAGLISIPLIASYLYPLTLVLSPDILSVFLNFISIFLWAFLRKKINVLNFILLAIMLGLGFLTKLSLNIIWILIIIDLFFILKKQKVKHKILKLSYFTIIFLLCWTPYNIYSITQFYKIADKYQDVFNDLENMQEENFITKYSTQSSNNIFSLNKCKITIEEIKLFKQDIIPFIENKLCLPYDITEQKTNPCILKLVYFKFMCLTKKPYLMIYVTPAFAGLDSHNEYVTEGERTNEWLAHNDSFYNNDGLKGKSQLKRILNFYIKNPSQIFKIAHSKLKQNTEHTNIINIFTIIALIFLVLTALETNLKKQNKIIPIIILSCSLLLTIFVSSSRSYIFILVSFILIFTPRFKSYYFPPFILLLLNGIAFTLIAYSVQRFLIYYMFILYFLSIFLIIEIINILKSKNILSSYCKNKKIE